MNERIKELSDQAWAYATKNSNDGDGKDGIVYTEKFAELLIRECTDLIDAEEIQSDYGDIIKKHFGVK